MPILKHAKKKLKQDKVRNVRNKKVKDTFKELVKKAKAEKTPEALSKAFSSVDKAVKVNILPKNRAAHMKSSLSKFVAGLGPVVQPVKKVVAKKGAKKLVKKSSAKKAKKK